MKLCSVDNCKRLASTKSLCHTHYCRKLKHGSVELLSVSDKDRFEKFIEKIPEGGCWLWKGATIPDGYGYFKYKGKWGRRSQSCL